MTRDKSQPDPLEARSRLTFEQVEGAEPLPTQLKPKELSPLLRSAIWAVVYEHMRDSAYRDELSDFGRPSPTTGMFIENIGR
jgi:hypothetical protein